ncbi:leucine-rich repeat protein [Parapedobacter tibetensis]|uniref:leucine-rich repeat protein n=1 Tax=Parapedobacter tibetensis TaxID=2972951 RepID=UPI00214D5AC2|nr:leucine-rich repeat protein [Parapedobacter tibetensis]
MKKLFLLACALFLTLFAQAQYENITITTTAGKARADLIAAVDAETNLSQIRNLKINGTLNAQDFADLEGGSGTEGRIKQTVVSLDLSGITAVENKEIPKEAFYQFAALQNVTLPGGGVITTISENAFGTGGGNDAALVALDIPEGVTTIKANAFNGQTKVTTLHLPSTLRTIETGAFNRFNGLEHLTLPEGLAYIGSSAFYMLNNPKMTAITIPASVEYIGGQAFAMVLYAEGITFAPRNGKAIEISGDRVFRSAGILSDNGMSVFEFPDNTTISFNETGDGILRGFFASCDKLKEIRNLPAGLTEFRVATPSFGAFSNTAIEELTIPETVAIIGNNSFQGTQLKSLVLPDAVTTIGNNAFQNITTLTSIDLGDQVTSIGNNAFRGVTALETLELPATVTAIGDGAFQGMTGLKALVINNPEPIIFSSQKNVFTDIDLANCLLYVPANAVQDYKDFDLWNAFANIKAIGSDANEQTLEGFHDITATVGAVVELNATASSGLSVTYEIADESIATLEGNKLTILKEGETTVTAKQAGDGINFSPVEKTVKLLVVNYDWLEEVAITVEGNTARVVGPADAVARFTKFYVNDAEVELGDGTVDLSESTGELSLKATTADGTDVIKLKISK